MRDDGLAQAIKSVGGVGALARGLGISQPSVSGWTRVPAERVPAVEALTGVNRHELRPDLFNAAPRDDQASRRPIDEVDQARGHQYLLLAAFLRSPPTKAVLGAAARITGDASALGIANIALADAASTTAVDAAGEQYFSLFVGVGRGELLPYGSYYLSGFLHDRPLARLREDLARLGIARATGVHEPEDHIASELEVMAGLVLGSFDAPAAEQARFFEKHLAPWALRFFADLAVASGSGPLYRAVAEAGRVFLEIEAAAFALPE